MRSIRIVSMVIVFLLLCSFAAAVELQVAGIQWEMRSEFILDESRFWEEAESAVELGLSELENSESGDQETLVVFPEYTSLFLALQPYAEYIRHHESIEGAWSQVTADFGYEDLGDLFTRETAAVYDKLERWSQIARGNDTYLIPGTMLVYDWRQEQLVNRMVLIEPDGEIGYYQDKVYITPFEEDMLEVEASATNWAEPFSIAGTEVAVTICRDTFFEDWEERFAGVDLWIDLKANGQEYTAETEELFSRALPERISALEETEGMTVCLTGEFMGLLWEGISSAIDAQGRTLDAAEDPEGFDLITLNVSDSDNR
ncbi:MAG: nitrilase-related carbon-nitrogen hydrolase [Spirochaetota bacterium]